MAIALAGLLFAAIPASADVSPANCLSNDFVVNLQKSTNIAYDQTNPNGATTIIYTADAGNPNTDGTGCNVDNVTITITDPHGTVHTIQTGGSYPIGTAVVALAPTVSYVANSADVIAGKLTASVNATGSLHDTPNGTDPLNSSKTVSVTVINPNTIVTIAPSTSAVAAGGTVSLTVTEQNTGNDPLTSPQVTLTPPGTVLNKASGTFTGGDTGNDGVLGVGETWTWTVTGVVVNANTTYTAVGDGIDSMGNHVTYPAYANERAQTTVNVVDAKISITPNGTNEINHKHIFTGHVDVNTGSGFVNAPDGTVVSFTAASGPGTFDSPTCTTSGGTGSCTDGLTSATPGVTIVNASTDVIVDGVLLHRTTDGTAGNSGPATKTWVDANIQISPLTATDPINDQHTLTGHVNINTGTGGYVNAPDGTVINFAIASGPGSLSAPSCTTSGGTGSCTDTLTSPTVGTTVVNASTAVVVGGVTLNRITDGIGSNSGSANKTWINNIVSMTTAIHQGATDSGTPVVVTSVPAGATVHDSAALTFNGPVPTGNVVFTFFSGAGANVCDAQSVGAGTVALDGSGMADPSNAEGPLAAGTYGFRAHYVGDGNYPNGATSACEPLTVTPKTPSISTALSATTVDINTAVHDSAILTGATSNAGGTVKYSVYAGANTCTGTDLLNSVVTVVNGIVPDSANFTPTAAGTYSFQATYSGDANNTGPVSSICSTEQLVVNQPQVATRTLGFWQTHTQFTESVFNGTSGGSITLGGMAINTDGKLFGGFLAGISKKSDGTKRSALDQARMQLAQQWLAAELNCEAFTCPASITTLLSTASTDFSSGTASQILADASALDAYNNSGDIIPTSLSVGSATPQDSKSIADIVFWNNLH